MRETLLVLGIWGMVLAAYVWHGLPPRPSESPSMVKNEDWRPRPKFAD